MRISAAAPAVFAACLLVGGCGGDDDPARASSGDVPTALGTPTVTVSSPAGSPVTSPPASPGRIKVVPGLPESFPADDVPLYDATVIAGSTGEPTAPYDWSVVLQPAGPPKVIAEAAGDLLEDAGFTEGAGSDLPRLQVRQYSNSDYEVGLTVTRTGDGNTMTYLVTRKD